VENIYPALAKSPENGNFYQFSLGESQDYERN